VAPRASKTSGKLAAKDRKEKTVVHHNVVVLDNHRKGTVYSSTFSTCLRELSQGQSNRKRSKAQKGNDNAALIFTNLLKIIQKTLIY